MEQKVPLFKGSIDGVQFDDYSAFTKFLHEHPESACIEFSLNSSANKKEYSSATGHAVKEEQTFNPISTTCHVVENGQALNPNELMYPLLETPDHYLATHDQSKWLSDLDKVVTYANSFNTKHQENIKYRSNQELEEHKRVLSKCSADVVEALKFNEEADKSVRNSATKYFKELEDLNEKIKSCKQRINVIRKEEMPALENKKQALAAVGKLLGIYREIYDHLQSQVDEELSQRKNNNLGQLKSGQLKTNRDSENGMIRLLNAIFGL